MAQTIASRTGAAIEQIQASAYEIPADFPESDGTYEWKSTTLVIVEARGGDECGVGYTYADLATLALIRGKLAGLLAGLDAMDVPWAWERMVRAIRNLGRPGIASMAISAVDSALWDLKAKLLGLPLAALLGMVRKERPPTAAAGSPRTRSNVCKASWRAGRLKACEP